MPRLEGKPAPINAYLSLIGMALILLAVALEYLGLIDLIPNFGM